MSIDSIGAAGAPGFPGPGVVVEAPEEDLPEEMAYLTEVPRAKAGPNAVSVRALQRRLKAAGFDPGPVDGWFGPRTAQALRGFQAAHGLKVDAQAGPKTWAALGLRGAPRPAGAAPPSPSSGANQASNLGFPPVAASTVPLAIDPGAAAPEGSPHDRRQEWFLSQQRTDQFNPNEDVLGNGNCGPSSVTMIARAFGKLNITAAGVDAANEESRRRIGDGMDEKKGTSIDGLRKALVSYGLDARVKSSPNIIDLIRAELAEGRLVIAHVRATYLRPNATTGHYTVVTQIANGRVYLNDSTNKGGPIDVSIADFVAGVQARGTYTIISAKP